ncbi:MAG: Lrp/AsnC family transcriptional regulator [Maricaulaceae bacterium]|nr:Lrp/AsnC family transcriptional regulator [Maricaulaceae bacterium]
MTLKLDEIDIAILHALQENAGRSVAEVADIVGLTPSPCWRRMRRLESEGVIRKRAAVLDPEKVGLAYTVFVQVKISPPTQDNHNTFIEAIRSWPEVVDAVIVTGSYDYILRVMLPSITRHNAFIRERLLSLGVVGDERSFVMVGQVKQADALPLDHLKGG